VVINTILPITTITKAGSSQRSIVLTLIILAQFMVVVLRLSVPESSVRAGQHNILHVDLM